MYRVLRYPRLCALCCASAMLAAAARDYCLGQTLSGWARVLLVITLLLLLGGAGLLSCRFIVDADGVGVGFLLRVRRTAWQDLSALGTLCCNSRKRYLYGLYRNSPDFLHMLHRAPRCGKWGFVVPMSRKLSRALDLCCPYALDAQPSAGHPGNERLRPVWHHALLQLLLAIVAVTASVLSSIAMLLKASVHPSFSAAALLTCCASLLLYLSFTLLYRAAVGLVSCPRIGKAGISAGRSLFLPWDEVKFGYVHRRAQLSGLFLLSRPLKDVVRKGGAPVLCLSMPDASTLILAYLTYCPHADRSIEA